MRYSLIFCMPKSLEFVSCQLCGKTGSPANSEVSRDELRNSCTLTWTTQNGVNGYTVTGANGNSIFLPAAGYRYGTNLYGSGSYAYGLYFSSGYYDWGNFYRYYGLTVCPVSE